MHEIKRVILIILDGLGVGAQSDAYEYGDQKSNTLKHVAEAVCGLSIPNLVELGLGHIVSEEVLIDKALHPTGSYGKLGQLSRGKDTTTGHWEIAGLILHEPFPTYPEGFPEEIISEFTNCIKRDILGNYPASGTIIIEKLGEKHLKTGKPIVYTSQDSVFQIAAHKDIIPLKELYKYCRKARQILRGEHAVNRVIARPFTGRPGSFIRTEQRKDFSLSPPDKTVLDHMKENGYEVVGIGKIKDIFAGRGITSSYPTSNNKAGMETLFELIHESQNGLLFCNLVDFDSLYGHRNDAEGFAEALKEFDSFLGDFTKSLKESDLMIITADHGCDPHTSGTDHTREYTPLLVSGPSIEENIPLGTRETFADIAATLGQIFNVISVEGDSFYSDLFL